MAKETLAERFWRRVNKSGECWIWEGATTKAGYGILGAGTGKSLVYAHRLSWQLANGSIPVGLFVCHRCDRRSCCNPSHLFIGTAQDNNSDIANKGRGRKSKSGLPFGVVVDHPERKGRRKFFAQVKANGKARIGGYFATPEEAHKSAVALKAQLRGGSQ